MNAGYAPLLLTADAELRADDVAHVPLLLGTFCKRLQKVDTRPLSPVSALPHNVTLDQHLAPDLLIGLNALIISPRTGEEGAAHPGSASDAASWP